MGKRNNPGIITTFLGAEDSVEGEIRFSGAIRLDGRVRGKIISEAGTLIIGDKAVIEGNVSVGIAIIMGSVTGSIEAGERVEIYPPARVFGDILAPVMSVETGAELNGTCNMTPRTIARRTAGNFSIKSSQASEIIEVDKDAKNL